MMELQKEDPAREVSIHGLKETHFLMTFRSSAGIAIARRESWDIALTKERILCHR
jgi:hypothetical protein